MFLRVFFFEILELDPYVRRLVHRCSEIRNFRYRILMLLKDSECLCMRLEVLLFFLSLSLPEDCEVIINVFCAGAVI